MSMHHVFRGSYILLSGFFLLATAAQAADFRAQCKLKSASCGKNSFELPVANIEDEGDIDRVATTSIKCGEKIFAVAAGVSEDDECVGSVSCRWVLKALSPDSKHASIGYANAPQKIGVITAGAKISCIFNEID